MIEKLAKVILILLFCIIGFSLLQSHITVYAIDSTNEYNVDDLSNAIMVNNLELAKKIINGKTLDVNKKDLNDKYPLEMVLVMENCEMAELLLENGANPYVITSSGQSIYELVMNGSNKTLKEIFEESAENYVKYTVDQLSQAVLVNDIDTVNKIIESKTVNINQKDSKGKYPLERILVMGNCDMAKILLKAGADPHIETKNGKTIYELVMEFDSKVLKTIFLQHK